MNIQKKQSNFSSVSTFFSDTKTALHQLRDENQTEILEFLSKRPVHTIIMSSWINDNGVESIANRGNFFGYYNKFGELEGVALIGHTTLVDAQTTEALKAFAFQSRYSEIPIHIIMSSGKTVEDFWKFYQINCDKPRLMNTELFFELSFPFLVRKNFAPLRLAVSEDLNLVAKAHADVAFEECGKNPLQTNRESFLKRTLRRIEQGRCYVVIEAGKLLFKADVTAETEEVSYLEGIYVPPEVRGKGFGTTCLSELCTQLLQKTDTVCLLSNEQFGQAHRAYQKTGFKITDSCQTIFV